MQQAAPRELLVRSQPQGFTLIELLVVISIAAFLIATLGVTVASYLENAREQQTVATLRKIEGLIAERLKGLERAYQRPDFATSVTILRRQLEQGLFVDINSNGIQDPGELVQLPGVSREATEMLSKKAFYRMLFPQFLDEPIPFSNPTKTIRNRIQSDPSVQFNDAAHTASAETRKTESSELLYYALNHMEIFGIPPVATEFNNSEARDTDNDGLMEFIDGWGRPLRFYRAPTRLFKPYGILGPDGVAGASGDDDGNGIPDDLSEINFVAQSGPTDDLVIRAEWRQFAELFFRGIPKPPSQLATGSFLVNYDLLNQDPDDPYGLLLAEFRRLSVSNPQFTPAWLVGTEQANHPLWNFPTFDVYHKPLVVSAGSDGELGILEPFPTEDLDGDGSLGTNEDFNGNGQIDLFGHLAIPQLISGLAPTKLNPIPNLSSTLASYIPASSFDQASDNITNRSRGVRGR